jgi:hypothetical protein
MQEARTGRFGAEALFQIKRKCEETVPLTGAGQRATGEELRRSSDWSKRSLRYSN